MMLFAFHFRCIMQGHLDRCDDVQYRRLVIGYAFSCGTTWSERDSSIWVDEVQLFLAEEAYITQMMLGM